MKLKSLLNENTQSDIQKKLKELGFKKTKVPGNLTDEFIKIGTEKLKTDTLGAMSIVFTTVDVDIFVAVDTSKGDGHIRLEYFWEYPSGSNGYQVRIRQANGKWQNPERG